MSPRYLQKLLMLYYSHVLLLLPSCKQNNMEGTGLVSSLKKLILFTKFFVYMLCV